ncbi:hypothetical protein BJV74DRAFT_862861 [Russula compacta]|nr:hypothetical protein BJV74DRAFT_862861 [Russula compacta]
MSPAALETQQKWHYWYTRSSSCGLSIQSCWVSYSPLSTLKRSSSIPISSGEINARAGLGDCRGCAPNLHKDRVHYTLLCSATKTRQCSLVPTRVQRASDGCTTEASSNHVRFVRRQLTPLGCTGHTVHSVSCHCASRHVDLEELSSVQVESRVLQYPTPFSFLFLPTGAAKQRIEYCKNALNWGTSGRA